MKKYFLVLLTALVLGMSFTANAIANNNKEMLQPEFQPGVEEFIKGTYFQHKTELPDPNESVEVLKSYMNLLNSPNELSGFEKLVESFPDSRHAHKGLATAYYNQYLKSNDLSYASLALDEEIKASKIGFSYGKVLYIPWVKQMALDANRPEAAINWFEEILKEEPDHYLVIYHYADLLQKIKDDGAEKYFLKAIEVRPTGNIDANVGYVEFLLDNNRYQEALNSSILVGENAFYLDFLHGYALEKLGRGEEAIKYYQKFEEMSKTFPAPDKYKITDSLYQKNITFQSDIVSPQVASAQINLSWVTACEAGGESVGGLRQVAWSVRQRVNRGTIPSCLNVDNSGSNLNEKYSSVICQTAQYEGVNCSSGDVTSCTNSNTRTSTSDQVANDVYYGVVPDPFTGYCPNGDIKGTDTCTAFCTNSNSTSWYSRTPHSFLAYSHTPDPCMKYAGAICGDGGSDNYFDYND